MKPEAAQFTLTVDDEGVVRVVQATAERVTVTPEELGLILTALVKALCGPDEEEQVVDVRLN